MQKVHAPLKYTFSNVSSIFLDAVLDGSNYPYSDCNTISAHGENRRKENE